MTMMLSALCYKDYERLEFIFAGGSSCVVAIARTYLTDKPQLSPCQISAKGDMGMFMPMS